MSSIMQANKHLGKNLPVLLAMYITSQMLINIKNYPSQPRISFTSSHQESLSNSSVIQNCLTMLTARSNIYLAQKSNEEHLFIVYS